MKVIQTKSITVFQKKLIWLSNCVQNKLSFSIWFACCKFYRFPRSIEKVLNCAIGFQELEVLNLAKMHKVLKKCGNSKFSLLFILILLFTGMTVLQMFFALYSMNKIFGKW